METELEKKIISRLFNTYLVLYDTLFELLASRDFEKSRKFLTKNRDLVKFNWHKYYELEYSDFVGEFGKDVGQALNITNINPNIELDECVDVLDKILNLVSQDMSEDEIRSLGINEKHALTWSFFAYANEVMMNSILKYEKNISELINEARHGNIGSFKKLIDLDPSIISTGFGKNFMCIASFTQDIVFIRDVSNLIKRKKKSIYRNEKRRFWAFHVLSMLGYNSRPYSEWADFLSSHGFEECSDEGLVKAKAHLYKVQKAKSKK